MRGQLFPDCIECAFLNTFKCDQCGRSGEPLLVSYPTLAWSLRDHTVLIRYPVQCSCGGKGEASAQLPFLLFCFIFGWLEYQGVSRNRTEAPAQQIWPGESVMLAGIFCDFEDAFASFQELFPRPSASDRILFEMGPRPWRDFLRRLGFESKEGEPM